MIRKRVGSIKLGNNKWYQIVLCFVSICIIWGIFSVILTYIEKDKFVKQNTGFNPKILSEINIERLSKKELKLFGSTLYLDDSKVEINVILAAVDTPDVLVLNTKNYIKGDIEEWSQGIDKFVNVGFNAVVSQKRLHHDLCYEVLLGVVLETDGKRRTEKISTNNFLYDGGLYAYNPLEFEKPDINSGEGYEVISNGRLYAYDQENKIWIYGYKGNMHWVLDSRYVPALEKVPGIPWLLYTYDEKAIPKDIFEEHETGTYAHYNVSIADSDLVKGADREYFLVSQEIPNIFPITYIWTGLWSYEEGWKYSTRFQFQNIQ